MRIRSFFALAAVLSLAAVQAPSAAARPDVPDEVNDALCTLQMTIAGINTGGEDPPHPVDCVALD